MKIGVVSDTHNNLKNVGRIVELFNEVGVERVIHTGDITQAKTLDVFAHLTAPLWGVFGNNDTERESLEAAAIEHGFTFRDPPFELHWFERRIVVVHDPLEFDGALRSDHSLALHGHTHLYRYESRDGQVMFNPGECAGHLQGFNAIGVLDLNDLSARLLRF